jgi:hypothetical protein
MWKQKNVEVPNCIKMNKTLYLKDEDGPIWDRARELSDDKISQVVLAALKKYVAEKEAEVRNAERIVVEYLDDKDHGRLKAKAFYGSWLIKPSEEHPSAGLWATYAIAITPKGSIVVWKRDSTLSSALINAFTNGNKQSGRLLVYPSWSAAFEHVLLDTLDVNAKTALDEALKLWGVPVEELDI